MKYYNVGDKVRIKSLDWYNEHKSDFFGTVFDTTPHFIESMSKYCGQVATITEVVSGSEYKISLDGWRDNWDGYAFEGLVQDETTSNIIEEEKHKSPLLIVKDDLLWYNPGKQRGKLFDPNTFHLLEKVLVRDEVGLTWKIDLFSHLGNYDYYPYVCVGGNYNFCIPYNEETKHLLGSDEDEPEYYRFAREWQKNKQD